MAAAAWRDASFSAAWVTHRLVVARLVGELPLAHRAAVGAGQHAFLLEQHEVAADGDLGDAEVFAEGGDAHGALCPERGDDARAPLGGQHLAHIRCGQRSLPQGSTIMTGHDRSKVIRF